MKEVDFDGDGQLSFEEFRFSLAGEPDLDIWKKIIVFQKKNNIIY